MKRKAKKPKSEKAKKPKSQIANKMEKDELLYLVDKNDNVIGSVLKSKAHGNMDLIHREVAIGVFNSKRQILIQKRSKMKKIDPGVWKITAAGHAKFEEDMKDATKRELEEELGIKVDPIYSYKFYSINRRNREARIIWVYYAVYDGEDFVLDQEEVEEAKWVDIEQISEGEEEGKICVGKNSYRAIMKLAKNFE